jgi:anti-anti-sigma regulatory factor
MLRIQREANGQVIMRLSGRLDAEDLPELKRLLQSEEVGRPIVLDLRDLTLVDQEAVRFLEQCNSNGIELQNCAPYISEWIERQRDGKY